MKNETMKQAAISALKKCLGKIPFMQILQIVTSEKDDRADFSAQMVIQDHSRLLLAKIKNNGQPRIARLAVYELKDQIRKETDAYGIFIAPYISPVAGKICEEAGIGYLDLVGNCLISFETVFIRQTGTPNPNIQKRELRSLYSPKGERILRVLLNDPKRNWKMTELAQSAMVSLGQVANIKKLLLDREWLSNTENGILLTNPSALLDEWGQAYNFQRNELNEYYALVEIPEIEMHLAETCRRMGLQYALTAFSSAARFAPMVRYQKASVYVKGDVISLKETMGWKAVSSGANVSLLIPYDDGVFYDSQEIDETMIASPLQTFLDLQSVHGRGQEAAQAVRKFMEKKW